MIDSPIPVLRTAATVAALVFTGCTEGGPSATGGGTTSSGTTAGVGSTTVGPSASTTTTGSSGGVTTAATGESTSGPASGSTDPGSSTTTSDEPVDFCGDALFCEDFEDYDVMALNEGQDIGPWAVLLNGDGRGIDIDSSRTTSGNRALHVFLDAGTDDAGGRLQASGDLPVFDGNPTHVYGRMMMYIEPVATSVHWSFFRLVGDAEPGSPVVGRTASYLLSSLGDGGFYAFVYGLEASGGDPFRDCSLREEATLPEAVWTCISFEMDSVTRQLRMWTDDAVPPAISVDNTGDQCVGAVPNDTPWYGPAAEQFTLGAQTFHPMSGRLDVWFDDFVLDTSPLPCAAD